MVLHAKGGESRVLVHAIVDGEEGVELCTIGSLHGVGLHALLEHKVLLALLVDSQPVDCWVPLGDVKAIQVVTGLIGTIGPAD